MALGFKELEVWIITGFQMKNAIKEQIAIAKDRLLLYLNAEQAILAGQSYEMGDMKLTRANLKDVQDMINQLKHEISALNFKLRGRAKFRVVRPCW